MINQQATRKLIIIFALVNAGLLALYVFLYLRVEANETEATLIYQKIGATKEGVQALEALEMNVKNTRVYRDTLEQYLVSEDETVVFLEEVEGLSRYSGASVKLTAVGKEQTSTGEGLKLSVSLLGSFSEVYHFLSLLESLPYKISITSVSLDVKNGGVESFAPRAGAVFVPENLVSNTPEDGLAESEDAGKNDADTIKNGGGATWQSTVEFVLYSYESNELK